MRCDQRVGGYIDSGRRRDLRATARWNITRSGTGGGAGGSWYGWVRMFDISTFVSRSDYRTDISGLSVPVGFIVAGSVVVFRRLDTAGAPGILKRKYGLRLRFTGHLAALAAAVDVAAVAAFTGAAGIAKVRGDHEIDPQAPQIIVPG